MVTHGISYRSMPVEKKTEDSIPDKRETEDTSPVPEASKKSPTPDPVLTSKIEIATTSDADLKVKELHDIKNITLVKSNSGNNTSLVLDHTIDLTDDKNITIDLTSDTSDDNMSCEDDVFIHDGPPVVDLNSTKAEVLVHQLSFTPLTASPVTLKEPILTKKTSSDWDAANLMVESFITSARDVEESESDKEDGEISEEEINTAGEEETSEFCTSNADLEDDTEELYEDLEITSSPIPLKNTDLEKVEVEAREKVMKSMKLAALTREKEARSKLLEMLKKESQGSSQLQNFSIADTVPPALSFQPSSVVRNTSISNFFSMRPRFKITAMKQRIIFRNISRFGSKELVRFLVEDKMQEAASCFKNTDEETQKNEGLQKKLAHMKKLLELKQQFKKRKVAALSNESDYKRQKNDIPPQLKENVKLNRQQNVDTIPLAPVLMKKTLKKEEVDALRMRQRELKLKVSGACHSLSFKTLSFGG